MVVPRSVSFSAAEWREMLGGRMPANWPLDIHGITEDSRRVRPGWLFVALRGHAEDGHSFLEEAVRRGACAAVVESEPGGRLQVPAWRVENSRAALVTLATSFFGHPSRHLRITGVTGTNGKTSVTTFLQQLLAGAGADCGLIGTVVYRVGEREIPARRTTPGVVELQSLLRSMVDQGCAHCAMEVSSHALDQDRTGGTRIATAVFTQLSQDHLDYHGTMENYFAAKAKLFDLPCVEHRLVGEDAWSLRLKERGGGAVLSCGFGEGCDVRAGVLASDARGTRLRLSTPWGGGELLLPLPGAHNVRNALQAMAAAACAGLGWDTILDGAGRLAPAPGRMERIPSRVGEVIVDYAHTPDALTQVLETLRPLVRGRLTVVFGCGGDRDRSKRAAMSRAVSALADRLILTQDNPRTEDPNRIFADMLPGIPDRLSMRVIPDRREAIHQGVADLAEDDLLLIAGKGHETVQELAHARVPFDDREVARQCLAARDASASAGEDSHA